MAVSIPNLAHLIAPLKRLLEKSHSRGDVCRKKKPIARFLLDDLGWDQSNEEAIDDLQRELAISAMLDHRDPELTFCVFNRASDFHWRAVVMHVRG